MKKARFRRILLPAIALLLALDLTMTYGMLANADTLDMMFGSGKPRIISSTRAADQQPSYYTQFHASATDSLAAAIEVSAQISDEGIVLLKNSGLLPLDPQTAVTPLGLRYCEPYYCGTGSSLISTRDEDVVSAQEGLHQTFFNVNTVVEARQSAAAAASEDSFKNENLIACLPENGDINAALFELDTAIYHGFESSCADTIGIVYIGRQTGENQDACVFPYEDGTPHMLAITSAEREILSFAKANCAGVIVVLCCTAPMQIPELQDDLDIDAILWVGGAGSTGYASLARILAGEINPSGRTPDTFPADFKRDPTFANQDDGTDRFVYSNAYTTLISNSAVQENANVPFHEYEEGIYIGYRYYETAFSLGELEDYFNRENGVVYPFGYGLSYTQFSQEIIGFSTPNRNNLEITVRVQNIGTTAGKDVVQLYGTAPYTQLDADAQIEKAAVQLIQFAKTDLLAPGQAQELSLHFSLEDMASYCFTRSNADGTKGCYMLERGSYIFSIRRNSHEVIDSRTFECPSDIWFDSSHARVSERAAQSTLDASGIPITYTTVDSIYIAATNRFESLSDYMTSPDLSGATILSRSDWQATHPTAPTDADRMASDPVVQSISASDTTKYDLHTDSELGNATGSRIYADSAPLSSQQNDLVLADLRGRDYEDPMWDLLLDQLNFDNPEAMRLALFESAYSTGPLPEIGKPASSEYDGPQGITLADVSGKNWIDDVCGYPAAPIMAATWNPELMYALGASVAQEALIVGNNGWYAPDLNILRSPFCGRSSEYYGEDPVLAGRIGAQVVSGAGDNGLACAIKHFALMETEMHRSPHTCTWMTEQALREIYLKPFEIVVKTAQKTIRYLENDTDNKFSSRVMRAADFIMASDSAIGTEWSAANYALLTAIARGEWGFRGTVISDMHVYANANMIDRILRSGCDMLMSTKNDGSVNASDYQSATGRSVLRHAVKNVCYTLVNSNLMQGVSPASIIEYGLSNWIIGLIAMNATVFLLALAGATLCTWEFFRERRLT